jgi:hypothetical protein
VRKSELIFFFRGLTGLGLLCRPGSRARPCTLDQILGLDAAEWDSLCPRLLPHSRIQYSTPFLVGAWELHKGLYHKGMLPAFYCCCYHSVPSPEGGDTH